MRGNFAEKVISSCSLLPSGFPKTAENRPSTQYRATLCNLVENLARKSDGSAIMCTFCNDACGYHFWRIFRIRRPSEAFERSDSVGWRENT